MLGDFWNNKRLLSPNDYVQIANGTPIVAFRDFAPYLQFGIFNQGEVIMRHYDYATNITRYKKENLEQFHGRFRFQLFEYRPTLYSYDKKESLERARTVNFLEFYKGYGSVFGDDFVFWCLVGDNFWACFENSKMGRHYKERYKEWKYITLNHHAIAIEQDFIVHFTEERSQTGKTHIQISPFSDLKNPVAIEYNNDNLEQRFITRNRALWAWGKGGDFGGYNILTNNCEHFATWCRTGKSKSSQVRTALVDAASAALLIFTPKAAPLVYKRLQKYFK